MTLGVAVVGCGLVGAKRAAALPGGASLVSVFDVDRARARAVAESTGYAVEIAPDAEHAIGHEGVGLVIVAVPHRELPELAIAALDAGRHVLVEKPAAADLAGVKAIAARAAERDRIARVGFNHRFHPGLLEAHRMVTWGEYGPVMHLRARYGHGGRVGYEHEWRADRSVSGGGELIDQGIHLVDLARFLAGDATLAFAELRTSFWPMEVEDNAFLALRCAGGAFAWLHASWTEWKNLFSLEVMLDRAKIEVTGLGGSYGTETFTLYEMLPEMGPPRRRQRRWRSDDSWARELTDCVDAIEGRASIGATIDDAVAAMAIVDATYSAR